MEANKKKEACALKSANGINLTMLCDFYELTMGNGYLDAGMGEQICYFDLFFRDVPDGGGFAIAAGLEQIVDYIQNLRFEPEDIDYLRSRGIFSEAFLDYLKNFRFTGDVWAVPEGTPIFPREPVITVRANAIQAQLAQCCCDNRAATADLKYTVATEGCATRTANADNTNALLTAFNAGFQSIKDQLCQDKIDAKNDVISQLRSELLYARGQASQDVQTAAIQAGQRGLANEVEQYVAPRAVPAYIVQNPNCCGTYGMACGG